MSSRQRTYRFLTAAQIQRLYITLIADAVPTQPAMLESAVKSPINVRHYTQEADIFKLAAVLSEKIMKNHAYADGNKRAALVAADMFLKINGYKLQAKVLGVDHCSEGLAAAHVAVTTGQWDSDSLSRYYRQVATPVGLLTPDIVAIRHHAAEH
ncbi:hypothetical protein M409DRAFT_31026 [Zasmidium cellare ATCC 36951]|uniref:Fido domain-containing protein n=1 Tax=Zasmidium cellare ATCC 36951 TaxID=1080233 RepID=A0A6A6BVC3_ZASCE|nr:uncharacterized protein M409DRAFT_31026 [Zasmidium cellare ATCC 36951]KAF2158473.1 hypothetical protein M409DRAFT_31026 [Zasmidium cellare ATCC 36951]